VLVPELYDIKKIRHHVKKVRDMILFPPLSKAVSTAIEESTAVTAESKTEEEKAAPETEIVNEVNNGSKADAEIADGKEAAAVKTNGKLPSTPSRQKKQPSPTLPSLDGLFRRVDIVDFFAETLFRIGKPDLSSSSPLVSSPSLSVPPAASASTSVDPSVTPTSPPAPALFSCIKSITLSGWNPPPQSR
jgi:hypothetical protein